MRTAVTGKNGYIGTCTAQKLAQCGINADMVDVRGNIDDDIFSGYDAVVHCAAIVHSPSVKDEGVYNSVNYALTARLARAAKKCGVKHFVFLSTMSVYGIEKGVIAKNTPLNPVTPYGKSKLKAERALEDMASADFSVTILRPPMVYGKNCPGNYSMLRKIALKSPFFPKTNNKKSMIYCENLAYFVCDVIKNKMTGTFMPANKCTVDTADMVRLIAEAHGKKIILLPVPFLTLLPISAAKKAFGTLYYDDGCVTACDYVGFEKSILYTECD